MNYGIARPEKFYNNMKLQQLKDSLAKFTSDFNDSEVVFKITDDDGNEKFSSLAMVAFFDSTEIPFVILGCENTAKMYAESNGLDEFGNKKD